jgi:hypothetical protein
MKTILIILFCISTLCWIVEVKVGNVKESIAKQTIDSLTTVTKQDSSFIHDVVTLPTDNKYDQIKVIVNLNRGNFRQWEALLNTDNLIKKNN